MRHFIKKSFLLLGPYPYNPYLIFLFLAAIMVPRLMPIAYEVPTGAERHKATATLLALSLVLPAFCAAYAWSLTKFRFWSEKSLWLYIFEVAIGQSIVFIYFPYLKPLLLEKYGYELRTPATVSPSMFIFTLFLFLSAFGLIHKADRKILDRLKNSFDLVAQLKADRQELINQDEEARRKTAQFLHDHLQSDLFLAGMKLKSIAGTSTTEGNEIIEKLIIRLENSRGKDLKNLIEVLSPNFESVGLGGAFEALLLQYESAIEITLKIDDASEKLDNQGMLGLYRIAEQALLNTLAHGPVSQVKIEIATSPIGVSQISISDDGPGAELEKVKPGVGSAIIDSWVELLNATKSINTAPGSGYRLVVSINHG